MSEAFKIRGKISKRLDALLGFAAMLVVLIVWLILTAGPDPSKRMVRGTFLPSPMDIIQATGELLRKGGLNGGGLADSIWVSVLRVFQALLLTTVVGMPIGILMGSLPFVDALLRKFIDGGKSIPTTAFIGLLILWFGINESFKIAFLFIGAIFYMILMTKNAILNVRDDLITVATDIGANRWQLIHRVLLPGALPSIWDAIIVCNGLMWTYIILAEYTNATSGLGHLITISSRLSRTDEVYATIIVIALISAFTDWVLRSVKKQYFDW